MTRVHQALERLRQTESQKLGIPAGAVEDTRSEVPRMRDFTREVERVQEPRPFTRRSPVAETRTKPAESVPLGSTTSTTCPSCRAVQEGPWRALWIRRLLGRLGIATYRCTLCRRRFSAFNETDNARVEAVFSTFLRPNDDRSFHDLIRDIALDEQALSLQGPGSDGPHGSERDKELRNPESGRAIGGVDPSHPRL